jgi:single-strand DNA-binding protein
MFYLNEVKIVGRATADAQVKQIGADSKVATFRIVSNRQIKKRDGTKGEKSTFVDVEVWGQRAEYAGNYVKRGTPVLVQGQLETDEWEKDGQKRSKLKIYANSIQAERPRGEPTEGASQAEPATAGATASAVSASDDVPF